MLRKRVGLSCGLVFLMFCGIIASGCARPAAPVTSAAPRNVILLIGDGMGFEHVKAGSLYATGREDGLFLQSLPYKAQARTISVPPVDLKPGRVHVTDSAAAATALATGHKVYNGVVSVAMPGDGQPYKTVLESFAASGKKTGLVTTDSIAGATPAGFGAHSSGRGNGTEIIDCYLKTVRPDVLLGGGYSTKDFVLTAAMVQAAGYKAVTNSGELAAVHPDQCIRLFGVFGKGTIPFQADKIAAATQPAKADLLRMPGLPQMATVALATLSHEKKGFFLMIEGALIDKAAHKNDLERCVPEVVEFDKTVKAVIAWARHHKDTLVLVTADHATGGLHVVKSCGKGQMPEVTWSTGGHTGANVPVYAWGAGGKQVRGILDNTDIYRLMMGTYKASAVPAAAPATQLQPVAASAN